MSKIVHCKDCVGRETHELYDGTRWSYCSLLRSVVKDDDYCSWAELKNQRIKDSKEIHEKEEDKGND